MLIFVEILLAVFLSRLNGKNALARGQRPTFFRVITIVLWFSFEVIAGIIAGFLFMSKTQINILGLSAAALGGLISFAIAKFGPQGTYVPIENGPLPNAQMLQAPCTIHVIREKSFSGAALVFTVFLNGQPMADLRNGESVTITTHLAENVITMRDKSHAPVKPLLFGVPAGGIAEIYFKPLKFKKNKCTGLTVL